MYDKRLVIINKGKSSTYPASLGETLEDREHELGIARRVIRQTDTQAIVHHVKESLVEEGLRQFTQVVLQKA